METNMPLNNTSRLHYTFQKYYTIRSYLITQFIVYSYIVWLIINNHLIVSGEPAEGSSSEMGIIVHQSR